MGCPRHLLSNVCTGVDKAASGFLAFLTNVNTLELITLLTHVLAVFSRYQKNLQSDSTTILDVQRLTSHVKAKLLSLKQTELIGGWVSALREQMTNVDGQNCLKDVSFHASSRRTKKHNLFVTDKRDISAVKLEIIDSLVEFLSQRFSVDDEIMLLLTPFATLQSDADLKLVHARYFNDLDLQTLGFEFDEVMQMQNIDEVRQWSLRNVVHLSAKSEHY
jgi:hypothetical protein